MEQERKTEGPPCVWISEAERILSFRKTDGFERRAFPDRDEMMAFVLEKGSSGYRIQ